MLPPAPSPGSSRHNLSVSAFWLWGRSSFPCYLWLLSQQLSPCWATNNRPWILLSWRHFLSFFFYFSECEEKRGRNLLSRPKTVLKVACPWQAAFLILFTCFRPTILSDSNIRKQFRSEGGAHRGQCYNLGDLHVVRHNDTKTPKEAGNWF